jgi:hypothetical protein
MTVYITRRLVCWSLWRWGNGDDFCFNDARPGDPAEMVAIAAMTGKPDAEDVERIGSAKGLIPALGSIWGTGWGHS